MKRPSTIAQTAKAVTEVMTSRKYACPAPNWVIMAVSSEKMDASAVVWLTAVAADKIGLLNLRYLIVLISKRCGFSEKEFLV